MFIIQYVCATIFFIMLLISLVAGYCKHLQEARWK